MGLFYGFIKSQRRFFVLLCCVSATYSLGQSILPYFIKHILNQLYGNSAVSHGVILSNIVYLFSFWLSSSAAVIVQGKLLERHLPLLRKTVYLQSIEKLQWMPHARVTEVSPGVLSRKITDLASAAEKIAHFFFVNAINISVVMILTLGLLLTVSPVFALLTLIWLSLHLLNAVSYIRSGSVYTTSSAEVSSHLSGKLVDLFSNIRAVHLFSNQDYEKKYLDKYLRDEEVSHRAVLTHLEKMKIRQSLFSAGFILLSVVLLVIQQLNHHITLGDFSMVLLLIFNVSNVVWSITFQLITLVKDCGIFSAAAKTIFDSTYVPKNTNEGGDAVPHTPVTITFKDISFRYPGADYLFKNLSLEIQSGEKVAISGSSGKGKTTLVNLLLGLYEPSKGEIWINQTNINHFSVEARQQLISYVPQETLFFNRTVLENVRYGNLSSTDEEVYEACRLAQCHEFIQQLEHGYETPVGEKGCYLSGGQLQRLAIARALLKKSPILVLDEPTSSLDKENSTLIEAIIPVVSKQMTLILITHRASTLKCADRIIEINHR